MTLGVFAFSDNRSLTVPESEEAEIFDELYFCTPCTVAIPLACEDYSNKLASVPVFS